MSMSSKKKSGLGRGLGNLLETVETSSTSDNNGLVFIESAKLRANPENPRKKFDKLNIEELAATIEKFGLLQPILVRKDKDKDNYIVISGERRLRACRALNLEKVPCIVKVIDEKENLEISLIENIQREQLDSIEEATVYKELLDKYKMTQDELASRVGKNRATIANKVRLLQLPAAIKTAIADNRLTEGQVRPLLTISNESIQMKLSEQIIKESLSAREIEKLVKNYNPRSVKPKTSEKKIPEISGLEKEIGEYLQTRVQIKHNNKTQAGQLVIDYFSNDEMERILQSIGLR